jgi:hypothetical protein
MGAGRHVGNRERLPLGRIIKRGLPMTVRENVHQLVDTLPEDRLADVLDYLADLQDEDTSIGSETNAAIDEGLNDIRGGRTISLSDYRRSRGL